MFQESAFLYIFHKKQLLLVLEPPQQKFWHFSKYIKYRKQFDLDHKFLLVNATGKKLSRKALGIILQKLSKKYTGKAVGSRMVRVLKATENKAVLDKAMKISKEMLHKDLKQTASYARK